VSLNAYSCLLWLLCPISLTMEEKEGLMRTNLPSYPERLWTWETSTEVYKIFTYDPFPEL